MSPAPPSAQAVGAPRQRTAVLLSILVALVVAAFVAFAALTAVPPTLANLASEASDGTTAVVIESGGERAEIVAPVGWVVVRESAASVLVRTPDSVLTARVDLVGETPDAVVAADEAVSSAPRAEVLASGRDVVHADLEDGGVLAAVALRGRVTAPSVRVVATTAEGDEMSAYRPALAQLLDGIAP